MSGPSGAAAKVIAGAPPLQSAQSTIGCIDLVFADAQTEILAYPKETLVRMFTRPCARWQGCAVARAAACDAA